LNNKKINRPFNIVTGYSCSCPPFECICTLQTNVSSYPQSHHHQTTVYSQQLPPTDGPYWLQGAPPLENTVGYCLPNQISQEASYGDFPPFTGDLFQPEEIFQLDQPLRPDFPANSQDAARSPPTLLDLGSGTIKYEVKQNQDQGYWNQFLSEDSSSSHLSLPQEEKLHFANFESEKISNGFSSRRMHHYVQEKSQNQPGNDNLCYQNYSRSQNQKDFIEESAKNEHEQSYWSQDQHSNRIHLEGFEVKEEDLLSSRREIECYKNSCQSSVLNRAEYNAYQRPKSEDLQDTTRRSSNAENKPYPFDDYHQMFEHGDTKNQPHNHVVHQNSTSMNLDDRLQGGCYSNQETPEIAERLFHNSGVAETSIQSQNSPEPLFYPNNDRCHYTCEILERMPQMMNAGAVHGSINNYGDQTTTDLDLPPFVDYTLVGMLCSSMDEDTSNMLPGCPQDSHTYIPHH